jgi:hypothetical protein
MHHTIRQTVCLGLALVVFVGGAPVVGLRHAHCLSDRPHRYDEFPVDGCPHAAVDASPGNHKDNQRHEHRTQHAVHEIDVHWHYFWLGIELGEIPMGQDGAPKSPTHEPIVAAPITNDLMAAECWPLESGVADAAGCVPSHLAESANAARSQLLATGPGDAVSLLCDAARLERTGVRRC